MKCYIKGYDKCKYEEDATKKFQYELDNVESFKVVQGESELPQKPESWMPKDPHNEYLVIRFADGSATTYFNSMVDLFKY